MTSSPPPSKDLATALHDCLIQFLNEVAANREGPELQRSESLLCPLALSLRRLLLHDSILLIWEDGARTWSAQSQGEEASCRTSIDAMATLNELRRLPESEQSSPPVRVTRHGQAHDVRAVSIAAENGDTAEQMWIVCETQGAQSDAWRWFVTHVAGLKSLYSTVRAILHAQAATHQHRAALHDQVKSLIHTPSPGRHADAVKLLRQLLHSAPADVDLFQDVAVCLLQRILGAGWRERNPQEVIRSAIWLCHKALERAGGREDLAQLRCVLRCLRVLHSPADDDVGVIKSVPLNLLPLWTQVHERWRPLCEPPFDSSAEGDEKWRIAVDKTIDSLGSYLAGLHEEIQAQEAHAPTAPSPARSILSVRNILYLWFCLRMLRAERAVADNLTRKQRNSLRAELAYVLRESLRFTCFWDRPDYFFHAPTFASALQVLITRHAHDVVELPGGCAVDDLLSRIAKEGGMNRLFAAEHLQHIVEIYIAGHYLLSMRLDAAGAHKPYRYLHGWTLAQALASTDRRYPEEAAEKACLQAFSLAVLFHDMDHLFLIKQPRVSNVGSSRIQSNAPGDSELDQSLHRLSATLCKAAKEEGQLWVKELLDAKTGYLQSDDEKLKHWVQGETHPTPHHGVLSAWYLHCIGSETEDAGFQQALRMAVRAVLLHNAMDAPLLAERDPVAALLVLCDEIFEWDPSQPIAPSEIGRSLYMMGTSLAPHVLRDRFIRLRDLRITPDAEAWLTLPKHGGEHWPVVEVTLQEPDRLDVPVYLLWLRKSRNLGRVLPARFGLGPTVVMSSGVSPALGRLGLTSFALLEELVEQVGRASEREQLRAWLKEVRQRSRTIKEEHTVREIVTLGPLGTSRIYEANFKKLRLELELQAEAVLQKRRIELVSEEPEPVSTLPPPLPDPTSLRLRMDGELRADSDLDAFCREDFPHVERHFSNGMDRAGKYDRLLQLVDPVTVRQALDRRLQRQRQGPIRVLLLASLPSSEPRLDVGVEFREIRDGIKRAKYRDWIETERELAVRPSDLLQMLLNFKPHIVHFSGHGEPDGIMLEDDDQAIKPLSKAALGELFHELKDNIRVVFLNACYSSVQAEAIREHIDCVIGMKDPIGDKAAIKFSAVFYEAIANGHSVQKAFEVAKLAILIESIPGHNIPVLLVRAGVDAAKLQLIA